MLKNTSISSMPAWILESNTRYSLLHVEADTFTGYTAPLTMHDYGDSSYVYKCTCKIRIIYFCKHWDSQGSINFN